MIAPMMHPIPIKINVICDAALLPSPDSNVVHFVQKGISLIAAVARLLNELCRTPKVISRKRIPILAAR
jgi:hypothetical protein